VTTWLPLATPTVRSGFAAFFLLLAANLAPAYADERPVLPEVGPDKKLTGGNPAAFFSARAADLRCQEKLTPARHSLVAAEKEVIKLVEEKSAASVIERAERNVAAARETYLDVLEICGPCATREIEKRKLITVTKTEIWNISDGSCYLDEKKFGKPAFERMLKYLARTDSYAAYRKGGLRNILEFVPIDPGTGTLRPEWLVFDKPFFVFISVMGPTILGETLSPQYVILNETKEVNAKEFSHWGLSFKGVPAPRGFNVPDVYVHSASGRKTLTRALKLPSVLGQWYIDNKGNLRYFTAADFGMLGIASGFTTKLARQVILETLAHVYEIGAGEKP